LSGDCPCDGAVLNINSVIDDIGWDIHRVDRGLMRHQFVSNQVLDQLDIRGTCANPSRPKSRWHFSQCRDSSRKEEWKHGRLMIWFSARAVDRTADVSAWSRGEFASVIQMDVH
jgi:hypothetical protein